MTIYLDYQGEFKQETESILRNEILEPRIQFNAPSYITQSNSVFWNEILIITTKSNIELVCNRYNDLPNVSIIMIGQQEQDAYFAYRDDLDGFVLEKNILDNFRACLARALKVLDGRRVIWEKETNRGVDYIKLPSESGTYAFIQPKKIMYFESSGDYTWCYTINGSTKKTAIHCGIGVVWNKVQQFGFIQTHRKYIINPMHITHAAQNYLTMKDGTVVEISKRRKKDVYDLL